MTLQRKNFEVVGVVCHGLVLLGAILRLTAMLGSEWSISVHLECLANITVEEIHDLTLTNISGTSFSALKGTATGKIVGVDTQGQRVLPARGEL
mmetsp:Transcript_6418/g.15511  ORF Transcript_6418/g.15511 Transcript_6418/m.15511 type:complete len:94 (+) Transcript_6418:713-994(+)